LASCNADGFNPQQDDYPDRSGRNIRMHEISQPLGRIPSVDGSQSYIGHLKLTEVAIGLLVSMCCVYGCTCARYGEDGDNYAESSDDEETFEHEYGESS
jgi:hypothetical protein